MTAGGSANPRPVLAADGALGLGTVAITAARMSPLYSRFVGAMKILLPLTAAALIGLVVAWPDESKEASGFRLSFANTIPGDPGAPGMSEARYIGTDANNQPFVITADMVTPDIKNPNRFLLSTLQADITFDNGAWMSLTAPSGIYDREKQFLQLTGKVDIFSDRGFELHTTGVRVDLARSMAEGDQPVQATGPLGVLEANGFRIVQRDERLFFTGGVKLTSWQGGR
ncbi:MAG: LPS export ABC transporter periplasmic protein LptC [Proteobacteria bacterium]|nr:LPS export ABC transporter periplasmic protein LptC [Pseudomonadota bacterium]